MRCFLAVPLQGRPLRAARELLERLRNDIVGVRWVRPEGLHITLHFFGRLTEADVRRAVDVLQPVIGGTLPAQLTLDTLGQFPQRGRPRVLWAGARDGNPGVVALAASCHVALESAGFEIERRAFHAHCTLARVKDGWTQASSSAWSAAVQRGVHASACAVERVVLFESRTTPAGAVYTPLEEFSLGPQRTLGSAASTSMR